MQPLVLPVQLDSNPEKGPRYASQVRRRDGTELKVVDPRATRALVALMDMNAVIGGAACHEGYSSCFFRKLDGDEVTVVGERIFDPAKVYKK